MQPTDNEEDARSAKDRTFGITEIHEAILIKLDMKTLLFAQRVSRDWQKLIDTSPSLQKKLFMQPATAKETIELRITHGDRNTFLDADDSFAALNSLLLGKAPEPAFSISTGGFRFDKSGSWKRMMVAQPQLPSECRLKTFVPDHMILLRAEGFIFRGETESEQVMGDYEPITERKDNVTFSLSLNGVRGMLSHEQLMEMEDAPPPWGQGFPGYVEHKYVEIWDLDEEEEKYLWDSDDECYYEI